MDQTSQYVTTGIACRIVRLDRARFGEAVFKGFLKCVPATVAGKARTFKTPDDLLALWYYRELLEDGFTREKAGQIACAVAEAARNHPEARAIAFVENYFVGTGSAHPVDQVPDPSRWDDEDFLGTDIRKVTTFRVSKARELIVHYTAKEIQQPDVEG